MDEVKKRKKIVTAVSCLVAVLCVWLCFAPASWCLPFHEVNSRYLEEAGGQTMRSMGCVALIKGVADVVEGSSITAGAVVVQGNVEVGDMAQPVLDVVTVIWNVMLVVAAYISTLCIVGLIAPTALKMLAVGYLCLFVVMLCWGVVGWRLRKSGCHVAMNRLMRLLCVVILFTQFALPFTLRISAYISQVAIAPMRAKQDDALDKLKADYSRVSAEIRSSKAVVAESRFWHEVWVLFRRSARELSDYACFALGMWFVEGLLIPLCALLFNAWLIRQYVMPYLEIRKLRGPSPRLLKEAEDEHE